MKTQCRVRCDRAVDDVALYSSHKYVGFMILSCESVTSGDFEIRLVRFTHRTWYNRAATDDVVALDVRRSLSPDIIYHSLFVHLSLSSRAVDTAEFRLAFRERGVCVTASFGSAYFRFRINRARARSEINFGIKGSAGCAPRDAI